MIIFGAFSVVMSIDLKSKNCEGKNGWARYPKWKVDTNCKLKNTQSYIVGVLCLLLMSYLFAVIYVHDIYNYLKKNFPFVEYMDLPLDVSPVRYVSKYNIGLKRSPLVSCLFNFSYNF